MSYALLVCRESKERKMVNREFVESLGFCFLFFFFTLFLTNTEGGHWLGFY
jgi:hypothetical protein